MYLILISLFVHMRTSEQSNLYNQDLSLLYKNAFVCASEVSKFIAWVAR